MASDQEFERLKQKYQPAMRLMEQLQMRLKNVNMEGNKLLIRGEAPSEDAKNKVWDQVKLIDSTYSDLICDITVSPQQQTGTSAAGAAAGGGKSGRRYTVKSGDTLSKISREFYGDANQYMKIFEANKNVLTNPDKISPGQELAIPE